MLFLFVTNFAGSYESKIASVPPTANAFPTEMEPPDVMPLHDEKAPK